LAIVDPAVRALLIDLEGTVYQAGRLIPGVREALAAAEDAGLACGFVTNTTSRPASVIAAELSAMGLAVDPDRLFTAPRAARRYLLERGCLRCHFLVAPALLEDFSGLQGEDVRPDAVVVGDLGAGFTFERLNRAFRLLVAGAELVALAPNRYYRGPDGLLLDVGAFVAALEYGSGRAATLVGKPAAGFFRAALEPLGVAASQAAVVGDDLEFDVGGAQAAGLRGILVRTGKFDPSLLPRSSIRPDVVLDSIAELPSLLASAARGGKQPPFGA
jgi:HAD superfamily hydrolase (TIGR01458 family)